MNTLTIPANEAAEAIGHWFTAVYDDLATLAKASDRAIRDNRGRRDTLTDKDLRAIRSAAIGFLDRHRIPEAAGITLQTGAVDPDRGSVEWWRRSGDHDAERVVFNLSSSSAGFYDFQSLEWFTDVVSTGQPAIHGPYLDYAGMDQYILTLMVPFLLDGDPLGTAGCDIEVRSLETTMIPILRHVPADAALVSKRDRVIVGNSGRFLVGNRVGDLPKGALRIEIPGPSLGLSLVAAAPL